MTTPGTGLARYGGPSTAIVRASLPERMEYAHQLAQAGLLPEAYRRQPANVLLAIERSEALGIHHMVGIESIHIIKGKSTLSGDLMRALIQRAGHMFDLMEQTSEKAVVECARRERPEKVFRHEWTIEEAQQAELTTHSSSAERWRKYPKAMLAARVTSEAARAHFADVLAGMVYTPEEMGADVDGDGCIVDVTATATVHQQPATPPPPARSPDYDLEAYPALADRVKVADLDGLRELWREVADAGRRGVLLDAEALGLCEDIVVRQAAIAPATDKHLTRVHAALGERGVTDRDDKLETLSRLVGRRLTSSSELTCAEADTVYDAVRNAPDGTDLVTGEVQPEGTGAQPDDDAGQWMQPGETE